MSMSLEYCHECDQMIDTDYNAEHFIPHCENRVEEIPQMKGTRDNLEDIKLVIR